MTQMPYTITKGEVIKIASSKDAKQYPNVVFYTSDEYYIRYNQTLKQYESCYEVNDAVWRKITTSRKYILESSATSVTSIPTITKK